MSRMTLAEVYLYLCIQSNKAGKRQTNETENTRVSEALKQEARGGSGYKRQTYNLMSKIFKIKRGGKPQENVKSLSGL